MYIGVLLCSKVVYSSSSTLPLVVGRVLALTCMCTILMFMYGVDNENDLFYLIFLNITVTASSKLSCAFLFYLGPCFHTICNQEKENRDYSR